MQPVELHKKTCISYTPCSLFHSRPSPRLHKVQNKISNARCYRTNSANIKFSLMYVFGKWQILKKIKISVVANLSLAQSTQMTVTSLLFLLMQSRVRLLVPPLRTPSPSWGDGGGPDAFMAWGDSRDRLEACKDGSLSWWLVSSVCSSHRDVCSSPWFWSLSACSAGSWPLIGCRSLRSSNSSLFSSSASASSCLLRRSAPNRARMSHIKRDIWPCEDTQLP